MQDDGGDRRGGGRIPVTVLTGFLGSGKTTLLNALLRDPALADTAVIVNELGEIGLDNLLLPTVEDNIVLLDSGCLCCGLINGFRETLADLYARRAQGTVPPFARVIVETTGMADPAPLLQSLLRDPIVSPVYAVGELVTVVDALLGSETLGRYAEARKQVSLADRLVMSKADLKPDWRASPLLDTLRGLNPLASIGLASQGAALLDGPALQPAARADRDEAALAEHDHAHRHEAPVRADSFILAGPVAWSGVAAYTDAVKEFFGSRLLRCKGLLEVTGARGPVLVQGVQGVFSPPETLADWPDADRRSRLVCISDGIDANELRAVLSALDTEPGAHRPATLREMMQGAA